MDGVRQMAFKANNRFRSLAFAAHGICHVVRHEPNMRLHIAGAAVAMGTGLWLGLTPEEWRWIGLSIALVTSAECLNTAVERACDVADPELNPLIKQAKDAAAGAVLIAAVFAAWNGASIVWLRLMAI